MSSAGRYQIVAVSLRDGVERTLITGVSPKLAPNGDLLFVDNGTLWRVGFNKDRLSVIGAPSPVVESVRVNAGQRALFAVSTTGTLAYVSDAGNPGSTLVWIDRNGAETNAVPGMTAFGLARVSPEGRRIVTTTGGAVWVIDVERGTRMRLTADGGAARPIWSPDGRTITFQRGTDVVTVPTIGGDTMPLLVAEGNQFPDAWTPDGKTLIFNQGGPVETRDLWTFRSGESPQPLQTTPFGERGATIAPNGQWLAFVSTDAGRDDVYVMPFPGPGPKVPVSPSGGWQPLWSRDGKELFFRTADWMMSAPVDERTFRIGAPRRLFQFDRRIFDNNPNVLNYDVAPDGRFLAVRRSTEGSNEIRVIVNWLEELKRLGPPN
jgi:hypothetical protein